MKSRAKARIRVQDRYNQKKEWEISMLSGGGYYLRQYISGRQHGRGIRTTKNYLEQIGILDMRPLTVTIRKEGA